MRPWDHLLMGERNPFRADTAALRKVKLDEAAYEAAERADTIRRGQKTFDQPNIEQLRKADALEVAAVTLRILALNEDRARAFVQELKALNG